VTIRHTPPLFEISILYIFRVYGTTLPWLRLRHFPTHRPLLSLFTVNPNLKTLMGETLTAQDIISHCITRRVARCNGTESADGRKHLTTACIEVAFERQAVRAINEFKFNDKAVTKMIELYVARRYDVTHNVNPEMFAAIHEKAQLYTVTKDLLNRQSPLIWLAHVFRQDFDTAKEVWKFYEKTIAQKVDLPKKCGVLMYDYLNHAYDMPFDACCGVIFDHFIEILKDAPNLRQKMCHRFETVLIEAFELDPRDVTWNDDGIIMIDGEPEFHADPFYQDAITWMVQKGWTPHADQSSTEMLHTLFKDQYFEKIDSHQTVKLVEHLMSYIDEEVQTHVSDGVYMKLANILKRIHQSTTLDGKELRRTRRPLTYTT